MTLFPITQGENVRAGGYKELLPITKQAATDGPITKSLPYGLAGAGAGAGVSLGMGLARKLKGKRLGGYVGRGAAGTALLGFGSALLGHRVRGSVSRAGDVAQKQLRSAGADGPVQEAYRKRYGVPKTNAERVMSHYGVSRRMALGMLKKKPASKLLPKHGTGLVS